LARPGRPKISADRGRRDAERHNPGWGGAAEGATGAVCVGEGDGDADGEAPAAMALFDRFRRLPARGVCPGRRRATDKPV